MDEMSFSLELHQGSESKKTRQSHCLQHLADLDNEDVLVGPDIKVCHVETGHSLVVTWHFGVCCMDDIVGTVLYKWRDCGPFCGGVQGKEKLEGEPLRQTHLATIHIHVHSLINGSEIKRKASPVKQSMIPVPYERRVNKFIERNKEIGTSLWSLGNERANG
ncbi:unnamed protein product [Dovyalis caffra]|uniref:Uncharacterized protein n=1 Tax=Dovyalis caffra TaxID=77055 RepID=A0AAV1SD87_9ROSI|nr:unnamed protein product [Dovyalis caffra]